MSSQPVFTSFKDLLTNQVVRRSTDTPNPSIENANFYPIEGKTDPNPEESELLKGRIDAVEEAYRRTVKALETKRAENLIKARDIFKKDKEKLQKNAWRTESEIPGFDADSIDDQEFAKF